MTSEPHTDTAATRPEPRVLQLSAADHPEAGGKARGLARLAAAGLRVPDGLVVLDLHGPAPAALRDWYAAQGAPPVAVRSSGRDEDGAVRSFAGQYESVLDVRGLEALDAALAACLASAASARARAYADGDAGLAIVVQRMVRARSAGVVFTVDPVTGARESLLIESIAGLGEALVGGLARPDRDRVDRRGVIVQRDPSGAAPLLGAAELAALTAGALRAEAAFGGPLDLEWAIDEAGEVHWLQARPITTLAGAGLDEFDTPVPDPTSLFTRYNTGEVMPGAVTPLTWDVVGRSLDDAMRSIFVELGVFPADACPGCVAAFSGHVFLDLGTTYRFSAGILGSTKEGVDISLAGRPLPVTFPFPRPRRLQRVRATVRYLRFLDAAARERERFAAEVARFAFTPASDARGWFAQLRDARQRSTAAWRAHLRTSMRSGSIGDAMLMTLTGGAAPDASHHAIMAALLADVGDVVGADLVRDLERAAAHVAADRDRAARFVADAPEAALEWLRGPTAGPAGAAFVALLAAHGDRCIRELELAAADWSEDPRPLVRAMQAQVQARLAGHTPPPRRRAVPPRLRVPLLARLALRALVPRARLAIVERERSKALAIKVVRTLKRAFAALADCLVRDARLPDPALVYFLTLGELGRLVDAPDPALVQRAHQRRNIHRRQELLEFPMVSVGVPRPAPPPPPVAAGAASLAGTPVSRGVVRGPARVARTLAEAAALRPGEILITPHTDVGWTPCFSVAAGIATEIGGVLSHGAVVAREYGLPAVVDLQGATRIFKTGDDVVLDGDRGVLRHA